MAERRAVPGRGGVEHGGLDPGATGHQDRDELEVRSERMAEVPASLLGIAVKIDECVEPSTYRPADDGDEQHGG